MAHYEQTARALSLLRQEKGVSQRVAAGELGISQALLSHYENGIREPGLAFVVRACEYYGVSADFLLGRTLARDGTTILDADSLYDASGDKDNVLKGSVAATLSKKLLVNSVSVLFDLLGRMGNRAAVTAASDYLSTAVYTVFRQVYEANPANSPEFFSVPRRRFRSGLCAAEMAGCAVELADALEEGSEPAPEINHESLSRDYPGTYQSVLQIIHRTGERMCRRQAAHADKP